MKMRKFIALLTALALATSQVLAGGSGPSVYEPFITLGQPVTTFAADGAPLVVNQTVTGSGAQSAVDIPVTWNTSGTPTALRLNVTDTASNAASRLISLTLGGAERFYVNKDGAGIFANNVQVGVNNNLNWAGRTRIASPSDGVVTLLNNASTDFSRLQFGGTTNLFPSLKRSLTELQARLADDSGPSNFAANAFAARGANGYIAFGTTDDVVLIRDAADVVAQRRGTNAQTLRIYNTYTDASNYERGQYAWSANVLIIGTEAAGTGSNRALSLRGGTGINFSTPGGTARWLIDGNGYFLAGTDNTYDIGGAAGNRPRDIFVADDVVIGGEFQTAGTTVGALPTCNAALRGAQTHVTDATAPTFLGVLVGGGAVVSPAFCNGTAWVAG